MHSLYSTFPPLISTRKEREEKTKVLEIERKNRDKMKEIKQKKKKI